jgi:hypothetical protein
MGQKLIKLFLFTLGVLFFTGGACPSNDTTASNKVAQSEIYQSYSVKESGQYYEITAFFRVGGSTGTTLALIAPSKVTFNGQPMQEQKSTSSGTFYTINVPNNTPNGTFSFIDRDGKTFNNKIDLAKIALNSTALKANGVNPVIIPLPRTSVEPVNLTLRLNGDMVFVSNFQSDSSEAYLDKAKNAIVVMPATWKKFPNGNVSLNVEVANSIPTQQGTALGGNISFNYNTAPISVALVKGKGSVISNKNSTVANVNTANVTNTNSMATNSMAVKNTNAKVANSNVKKSVNTKVASK